MDKRRTYDEEIELISKDQEFMKGLSPEDFEHVKSIVKKSMDAGTYWPPDIAEDELPCAEDWYGLIGLPND
jgi:hypothetical protein